MSGRRWTKEEDAILQEEYPHSDVAKLALKLDRTIWSIRSHAIIIGTKSIDSRKWTKEEDNYLIKNWQIENTPQLAIELGKTTCSIQHRARRLHLKKAKRAWEKEQIMFLKDNWAIISASEIALHLNRDRPTVYNKARELNLKGAHARASIAKQTSSNISCDNCGKFFYRSKSRINTTRNFCCPSCSSAVVKPSTKTLRKILLACNMKPNKVELFLDALIQKQLPNKYRFNGDFSQGVMLASLIPDFINVNGEKKVIELFGDYWHDPNKRDVSWKRQEFGRKAIFSQLGYKTLIIWEHELKDTDILSERIKEFDLE